MKKFLASILTLALCLGLATGCAGKQTPAENDTESAGETGVKEIPSLKIAFSPYADADQITTATEPLEQLLQAKLLEKGYDVKDIDMTVGTSYTAVGEALSAGSADIGFISGGNYVLFSDDCDVLLTALRYAINKDSENPADWNDGTIEENTKDMSTYYRCIILAGPSEKGQELQAKVNAGEELTWDDLNSATWSVLSPTSAFDVGTLDDQSSHSSPSSHTSRARPSRETRPLVAFTLRTLSARRRRSSSRLSWQVSARMPATKSVSTARRKVNVARRSSN